MSEEIGKHKGAVETLLHEKKELSRLLQIVNSQLQKHLGALEESGIDTDQFIQEVQQGGQQQKKQRKRGSQQKTHERSSQRQQTGRKSSNQESEGTDKNGQEEDADDLLEGEDDFSDRDFSPR